VANTFNPREPNWMGVPKPLLVGRTGRVFITSDTPSWFLRWIYRNAMIRQIRDQILGFVGIKPVRVTHFSGASHPEAVAVARWIETVKGYGVSAT
tara:strand:- start:2939 stop:3223 length:285 start_codon:yes stop_codon:yes gene_type:complete